MIRRYVTPGIRVRFLKTQHDRETRSLKAEQYSLPFLLSQSRNKYRGHPRSLRKRRLKTSRRFPQLTKAFRLGEPLDLQRFRTISRAKSLASLLRHRLWSTLSMYVLAFTGFAAPLRELFVARALVCLRTLRALASRPHANWLANGEPRLCTP